VKNCICLFFTADYSESFATNKLTLQNQNDFLLKKKQIKMWFSLVYKESLHGIIIDLSTNPIRFFMHPFWDFRKFIGNFKQHVTCMINGLLKHKYLVDYY